jgi:hypothetical protein
VAGVHLGLGALTVCLGIAGIAVARFVPGTVTLPGVVLDSEGIRAAATALCLFVALVGGVNGVSAAALVARRDRARPAAVAASGLTAALFGWVVLGLVFQRGVGPLPAADAAAIAVGALALLHGSVCGALVVAALREGV